MAPTSLFVSTGGKRRAGVVMMTLLALLALVLAACGGGNSPNQAGNGNGAKNSILTVVPSPVGDFTKSFSPFSANKERGDRTSSRTWARGSGGRGSAGADVRAGRAED